MYYTQGYRDNVDEPKVISATPYGKGDEFTLIKYRDPYGDVGWLVEENGCPDFSALPSTLYRGAKRSEAIAAIVRAEIRNNKEKR